MKGHFAGFSVEGLRVCCAMPGLVLTKVKTDPLRGLTEERAQALVSALRGAT